MKLHALFPLSQRSTLAALSLTLITLPVHAVGHLADITVRDRDTGRVLPVYQHEGRYYVAGKPGHRYSVSVRNQSGGRLLAVMSVDGVNVLNGQTADWGQTGYVFNPWQHYEVSGWRKSQSQIAAFEFTALPNSYAARTGRPDNVGVIGVALFREQPREVAPPPVYRTPEHRPYGQYDLPGTASSSESNRRAAPAAPATPAPQSDSSSAPNSAPQPLARGSAKSAESSEAHEREEKLGTGHGQREQSWVSYTSFNRAQTRPNEVITIWYDSRDNLIAQGVIPDLRYDRWPAVPQPFPHAPVSYVPDPPRR